MTPGDISALVNMGSAGAVILVVIVFLNAMAKRDAQMQEFFKELRKSDVATSDRLSLAVENTSRTLAVLIDEVRDHDKKVAELFVAAEAGRQGNGGTDQRPRNGIR